MLNTMDYYQHGYDSAAIRFAYIPDFPTEQAKIDWERGYKDGMKKLEAENARNLHDHV